MDEDELTSLLSGRRKNPIRVCRIAHDVAKAIGSFTTVIWLSRDTAFKQETKRTAKEKDLYLMAPMIIRKGYTLIEPLRHAIFIYHVKREKIRSYKAVVKAAGHGQELYLVSVHRVGRTEVRAAFRRGIRLTEWKIGRREVGPPKNPT